MALFAITFRIHNDSNYAERYQSVVAAIKAASQGKYWDEPTSFLLIESPLNSSQLADAIDATSQFAASKDLLLVTNLSANGYKALGKVTDDDLHLLMKKR